jgi:prepilin-type N-terminal cleavage/methylation domain-containing protein
MHSSQFAVFFCSMVSFPLSKVCVERLIQITTDKACGFVSDFKSRYMMTRSFRSCSSTTLKRNMYSVVKKGFTLIELLVVIAIIALLLGVLLPALSGAQGSARRIKSQANLRSLAQIQEVYAGEYRGSLMTPFQIERFNSRPSGGGGPGQAGWGLVQKVGSRSALEFRYENRSGTPWYSEMYAFHWYSVVGGWLSQGDYASEVQFSPSDRVLINRVQDLEDDPPRGWSLETGFWDGSYILSPTLWFSPSRYREDERGNAPRNDARESMAKRNKMSDVSFPSQKVMMWERFDWSKKERTASFRDRNIGNGNPIVFGEELTFPQWNNPEAEPSVATADGSVSRVKMEGVYAKAFAENERVARAYSPTDNWDPSYDALEIYSMHEDRFEIGHPESGLGQYPAFFWATRDGVRGRDFSR